MVSQRPNLIKRKEIEQICQDFRIQQLDLFGSALQDEESARDYDFLVNLGDCPRGTLLKTYIDLADALEDLLGKPVDLITEGSLKNPYFRKQVLDERQTIYAKPQGKALL